jgi:hypothetical protein
MNLTPERQQWIQQVRQAIGDDPSEGAKLGATSLNQRVADALRVPQGVSAELLMATLGAIAGATAQETLRQIAPGGPPRPGTPEEYGIFVVVEAKDGRRFYFGAPLNGVLFEQPRSVLGHMFSFADAAGLPIGQRPDMHEIAGYVASTVGDPNFGLARLRPGRPAIPPVDLLLRHFWPEWRPDLEVFLPDPATWPVLAGASLMDGLAMASQACPIDYALRIAVEAAVAASKTDLSSL